MQYVFLECFSLIVRDPFLQILQEKSFKALSTIIS